LFVVGKGGGSRLGVRSDVCFRSLLSTPPPPVCMHENDGSILLAETT
jgi:hypothetical protein